MVQAPELGGIRASSDVILGAGTDDGLWPVRSQPLGPAIWIDWGARSSAFFTSVQAGDRMLLRIYILFPPPYHMQPPNIFAHLATSTDHIAV
jgi:hypothetical protein